MAGTARVISVRQNDLTARARAAADVANVNAAVVDADARFPGEAFAEIRRQRLLGIQVPPALGGEGASIAEIADVCYILGHACSSTALIYAIAPDQDGVHHAPLQGQCRARAHPGPHSGRAAAHGVVNDRRPGRRQRSFQRGRRRA